MTAPETSAPSPSPGHGPTRRTVLRYGAAAGAATVATATFGLTSTRTGATVSARRPDGSTVMALPGVLDLFVNEGFVPMVDGSMVYMRGFGDQATTIADTYPSLSISPRIFFADGQLVANRLFPPSATAPPSGRPLPAGIDPNDGLAYLLRRSYWGSYFPARTIVAETGSRIRLRIHNRLAQTHELSILGTNATTGPIAPGQTSTLELDAPAAGTYIYADPGGGSVERTLGLFGVLVVVPAQDYWRLTTGGVEFERQWLWICHAVDPVWARRAQLGETIDPVRTPPVPRYFTLNGRAGFQSVAATRDEAINRASHEETLPAGSPRNTDVRNFSLSGSADTVVTGQLIRMVNTGVAVHQMHFHGNHVWTVRSNGIDLSRSAGSVDGQGHLLMQHWEDTVDLGPLDRKEIVLPLKPPPDALKDVYAARTEDWHYPMHCHAEMSQTAAGGLYPGGIIADWVLAAPSTNGPVRS